MRFSRATWIAQAIGFASLIGCATHSANALDRCFYRGAIYSDGANTCQHGAQYRCSDGDWMAMGSVCTDGPQMAVARTCQFGGISFSTGSASCQSGTQYRCEDGTWVSIATPCTLGDSPIKIVPSGRTCMFDGVTVANGSTVCRTSSTFLCSDGEWVNLGTLCR